MQTKSKYLVWNEDQSDFEIHVPVILFDGIPLNNTCKADKALKMFYDTTSQIEIQNDLFSILNSHRNKEVRQKATDYSRHFKTTILFCSTEDILRSLLKENDINIRTVELNAIYKSSIIKSIEGSSQRAIKSDIYFSSKFLDSLPNTYINHNNRRIFIYSNLHENFWIFIFKYQKIIFSKDLLIKYIFIAEPVYKNLQINKYYLNKLKKIPKDLINTIISFT